MPSRIDRIVRVGALAIVLAFLLELGAEFIEAAYSFGLRAVAVPPATALAGLAFVTPLVLLIWKNGAPRALALVLVALAFGCRLAEPSLHGLARVLVAGAGFGALLTLTPAWIDRAARAEGRRAGTVFGSALALGCALTALCRVGGTDVLRHGAGRLGAVALALIGLAAIYALTRSSEPDRQAPSAGFGRTLVLALGIVCALELALSALMAPTVLARWFSDSHPLVQLLLAVSWATALSLHGRLGRAPLVGLSLAFAILLGAALWMHQPALPADPAGYPLEAPAPSTIARLLARLALALSGVVPIAFAALVSELGSQPPGARKLAGAFAIGGVMLLLLIAAQILTSIYDYVPVVGPLFRNRFWLVTALPAVGLAAALAAVRAPPKREVAQIIALACVGVLGVAAAVISLMGAPDAGAAPRATLRVVSYNIQQGYTKDGRDDLDAQLAVLRGLDADVIGLSECDTSRLAGGNDDIVRHLARELGMHVHYGPTPAAGTFGVAILSRAPIANARTFYLYSLGEQTALVVAELAGDKRFAATHLGNDGPIVQLDNTLAALEGKSTVMGDFNFVADSLQYAQTVQTLDDAWQIAAQHEGERLVDDLDHLFVTRGTRVAKARYLREDASDHPALLVELAPP